MNRAYQPAGECCLEVQNQGEVTDYERELDLEEKYVMHTAAIIRSCSDV